MIQSIVKRDGRVVLYDESKIARAILKALEAANEGDASEAARVANKASKQLGLMFKDESPTIEQIQDVVERSLMETGHDEAAKKYILYRANRTRIREARTSLMKAIDEIVNVDARESNMKRDNANIDGNGSHGRHAPDGRQRRQGLQRHAYLLTPEQSEAYSRGGHPHP